MSWSVVVVGKPAAVKAAATEQFNTLQQTLTVEHELRTVALAQQIVENELDFLATIEPTVAVRVDCHGSAWKPASGPGGSSSVSILVDPNHNFVDEVSRG